MSILHESMILSLRSLSTITQPEDFFLDGRTLEDTVGLAPSTDPPFTGTQWLVHGTGESEIFILECLGNLRNPNQTGQSLFLDGRTIEGVVGLTARTDPAATGRLWKIIDDLSLPGNKIALQCLGNLGEWANGFLAGHPLAPIVNLSKSLTDTFKETTWEIILPEGPLPGGGGVDNPPPNPNR